MRSASKQYGKCNPEERKEDLPLQRRRRKEEEKEEIQETELSILKEIRDELKTKKKGKNK